MVEPGLEFIEVNFKAHILNHQHGHPQAVLPEALTLRPKGWFTLGRLYSPFYIYCLFSWVHQELQKNHPLLLEFPEIKINAAGGQKLKHIPSYINLMEYNISRLLFLPITLPKLGGKLHETRKSTFHWNES